MRNADKVVSVCVFLLIATGFSLDSKRWRVNIHSDVASGYKSGILITGGIVVAFEHPLAGRFESDARESYTLSIADSSRQIFGIRQPWRYTVGLAYVADDDSKKIVRALWVPMLEKDQGCFTVTNVPPGQYWIFHITEEGTRPRYYTRYGSGWWLSDHLHMEEGYLVSPPTSVPKSGIVRRIETGGTYDFGWMIFVRRMVPVSQDIKLIERREATFRYRGETETCSVPEFLLRKHPDSPWAPRLKQLISKSSLPQMH